MHVTTGPGFHLEPLPIRAFSNQSLFQLEPFLIRAFSNQNLFQLEPFPIRAFSFRTSSVQTLFIQSLFQFVGKIRKFNLELFPLECFQFRSFSHYIILKSLKLELCTLEPFPLELFPIRSFSFRASSSLRENVKKYFRAFSIRLFSIQIFFTLDPFHLEPLPVCKNIAKTPFRPLSIRSFSIFFNQNVLHQSLFHLEPFPFRTSSIQSLFHLEPLPFRTFSIRVFSIRVFSLDPFPLEPLMLPPRKALSAIPTEFSEVLAV